MKLEKRVDDLERSAGNEEDSVWDIVLVGVVPGVQQREVSGYRDGRGKGYWFKRDGESADELLRRASAEVDRSLNPIAVFSEVYANSTCHCNAEWITEAPENN